MQFLHGNVRGNPDRIRLRFSTSRTMQTAQRLYEGVELTGMGQTALITYMRTDSTRVSNDALTAVRNYIQSEPRLGSRYLPASEYQNAFADDMPFAEAQPRLPFGQPTAS